jgi:hypothetical protein
MMRDGTLLVTASPRGDGWFDSIAQAMDAIASLARWRAAH